MNSRSQGEEHQAGLALMVLETLGIGDPTGAITLARYRYQTKITVNVWLTCLLPDGPVAVACERVEDQVVIHQMSLRFQQVKTRDRGVWTPAKVCEDGGGLDALVRSYRIAREAGHLEIASFELLLEGPSTDRRDGAAFFANPTTASVNVRRRLRDHQLPDECVDDFLTRLRLHPGRPSRDTIDGVNILALVCLFPDQSSHTILTTYTTLLEVAGAAQAGDTNLTRAPWLEVITAFDIRSDPAPAFGLQVLTRERLLQLLPPLPHADLTSRQALLHRMAETDTSLSGLEVKMISAGARPDTVMEAKTKRALAEVQRQQALAASDEGAARLDQLAEDVLTFAKAVATSVKLAAVGNPAMAARPAEAVFAQLALRITDLRALDVHGIFVSEPYGMFGFLCQLSAECRFPWRDAS